MFPRYHCTNRIFLNKFCMRNCYWFCFIQLGYQLEVLTLSSLFLILVTRIGSITATPGAGTSGPITYNWPLLGGATTPT